jgi:hypothetical protein
MTKYVSTSAKKLFAAGALAVGVASLGIFASAGIAAADSHNVVDTDGTQGEWDSDGTQGDWAVAVQSSNLSDLVLGENTPASSYPAGGSYPASPSWPGGGTGPDDN